MKRFLRILALWLTPTLGALEQTAAPARAAAPKRRSNRLPLAVLLLAALLAIGGQASAQEQFFPFDSGTISSSNGRYFQYAENGHTLGIEMSNVDLNQSGFFSGKKGWKIHKENPSAPSTITITSPGNLFDLFHISLAGGCYEGTIDYSITTSKGGTPLTGSFPSAGGKATHYSLSSDPKYQRISSFTITLKTSSSMGLDAYIDFISLYNARPIQAPSAPTGVSAIAGDNQATVSFTPPVNDGGAPVNSYTVTSTPGGITATGTQSPIVVTGLTNDTPYTFTVTASNIAKESTPSEASAPVTPFYKPDVLIVSDEMYDETQATAQLLKDFADRYDVTVSTTGVPASLDGYAQIYDVRVSQAITDNDLNQYYLFLRQAPGKSVFVAGERNDNTSFTARNQSISKLIEKLGGGIVAPPSKVSYDAVALKTPFNTGASSISTVKFTAPGIVTSSGTGSFIATEADGTSGAGIYFPKGTLASATEGSLVVMYDINFTYDNVDNSIQKAFRANLEQVMAAGGTLQGPSASSISLSATPSPAAVSAPVTLTATVTSGITGEVQFIEDGKVFGRYTLEKGVATLTTTSLASGTHTITVQYSGDAEHNASVSEALKLFIYTAPDAPTIKTATEGDGKASVSFTPPASDGGSPITSYTVTATPEGTGKSATLTVPATGITPGVEHTLEVTGLTNGIKYTFTVTASNAALTSVPSAAATTPIRLFHRPEITWDINTNIVYGTPLDEKLLNPTADVPGTFTYNFDMGTVLEARDGQTIFARFTPTDQNANIGLTVAKTINVAKATPAISWNPQTITYGTALGEAQLGAAALPSNNSMPLLLGTFTYTDNGNALKVGDILAAGDHTLKVAFVPNVFYVRNYNSVEATATLTVQKATPTIKWDAPASITYGTPVGNAQLAATASYNGTAVAGTLTYTTEGKTLKAGDILAAGDHPLKVTFAPTDAANYSSVEATVSLTVDKAPLTVTATSSSNTITKGQAIPAIGVTYDKFVNGEDESVLITKPTLTNVPTAESNAGEYVICVTGGSNNNYKFSYVSCTFTINKITPVISWNTPKSISYGTKLDNATASYSGAAVVGTITYTADGSTFMAGDILAAGDHTLKATFTPTDAVNYSSVEKTATITVQKAAPAITWSPKPTTYGTALGEDQFNATASYNGAAVAGTFSYTANGNAIKAGDILAAGDYTPKVTFTPTDAANYVGMEKAVSLTVSKAPLTVTANSHTITKGEAIPTLSVSYSGFVNGEDESVLDTKPTATTSATDASDAGTYDIVAANGADNNYEIAYVKGMLTISKITPTISWAEPATITYGTALGNDQLSATADAPGTFTYSPAAGSILNAGQGQTLSVTFTPTDKDNYNEVKKTVAISVAKAPLTVTASSHTITKGEAIPTLGVSYSGFVNGEDESVLDTKPTATTSATDASDAGTYDIVAANGADNNYELAYVKGTLTISKITPTISWATPATITYGTALGDDQLSATASYNGATVTGAVSYTADGNTLKTGDILSAGEHSLRATFTPTDAVNYSSVEKTVSLAVEKATPVITWKAPSSITYGTTLGDEQLSATTNTEGTFTYAPAAGIVLNTGQGQTLSVTFTPTDKANYNEVTKTVAITVAKAPLTATASSYSIREGEAIPALGVTYSGFVNGDTEAMLDTKPTATTNATSASPTGVYTITVAGGADDSYEFTYAAGTLTVSNPIVVDALQAPQPACEGDKLSLTYNLASGKPTEYQIVFDAKALTAGFSNSGYAALPSDNGTVSISIPSRVADGTYQAALQLRDGYGNISEATAFQVTVNVSADVIVPKFGSVVLIDNHNNRFTAYQWYRNGSAIGGATNQFYKDPNGLSGTYYAQLKTATGQTLNTCSKALSIKKSAQASVSVYPNPARAGQEFTVKLSGFADEELQGAVLSVYSTQGVPVYSSRKVEQENRITLSGTEGVYMGRIATADGQVLTFKVVLSN